MYIKENAIAGDLKFYKINRRVENLLVRQVVGVIVVVFVLVVEAVIVVKEMV